MSFYNGSGIPKGSEFKFELKNFGSRFKDIHKSDLIDVGDEDYMEFGVMTPESTPPDPNTMKENIYWDGADENGDKGIKEVDILFKCIADYKVNQIGLSETRFDFASV
jgi:hypothetical protein